MSDRDYVLAAQALLGADDHLSAIRRLRNSEPAGETAAPDEHDGAKAKDER